MWSVGDFARALLPHLQMYPIAFSGAFGLVCCIMLAAAYLPPSACETRRDWIFSTAVVFAGLLGRYPTFALYELNPDESQAIAGALTLAVDPRFWHSVEGGTHGPLVHFALLAPRCLGLSLEYGAARLVGTSLMVSSVIMLFLILRALVGSQAARAATAPMAVGIALVRHSDFVAYNAEQMTVLLLLACSYGGMVAARGHPWPIYVTGFLAGLVPLSKVQGVPMAVGILAVTAVALVFSQPPRRRLWNIGILTVGVMTPAAAVFVYLLSNGLMDYFVHSQVLWTFWYTNRFPLGLGDRISRTLILVQILDRETALYCLTVFTVPSLVVLVAHVRFRVFRDVALLLAMASVFVSLYMIDRPATYYVHYLQFLFFPMAGVAGITLGRLGDLAQSPATRQLLFASFGIVTCGIPIGQAFLRPSSFLQSPREFSGHQVAAEVARHASPPERLIVWGWMCRYYVLTGMPQGARAGAIMREEDANPTQEYLLRVFLDDFDHARPPVFVDAVGHGAFKYLDRLTHGHECFPELADRIRRDFRLVSDIEGARVYVRRPARP